MYDASQTALQSFLKRQETIAEVDGFVYLYMSTSNIYLF